MHSADLIHRGGCHCGAVRFEFDGPAQITVYRCNCSICSMTDFLHIILPVSKFRLLEGDEKLLHYRFNTGVAKHQFCRICGIKSFYTPRSNPTGVSVNYRCVAGKTIIGVVIEDFDGSNWEAHANSLAHLF